MIYNGDAIYAMRTQPDDVRAPENCRSCGAPPTGDKCEYCGRLLRSAVAFAKWIGFYPVAVTTGPPGTALEQK